MKFTAILPIRIHYAANHSCLENMADLPPPAPAAVETDQATSEPEAVVFDVNNPVEVLYCPVCTLPAEYCEFGPSFDSCKPWLMENAPHLYPQIFSSGAGGSDAATLTEGIAAVAIAEGAAAPTATDGEGESKEERRVTIGEASSAPPKKKKSSKSKDAVQKVVVSTAVRNRRKTVTVLVGLDTFPDIKLKDAAKKLGKRCACGSSVGDCASNPRLKEIVIQGDVKYDMPDLLVELFSIPRNKIVQQ